MKEYIQAPLPFQGQKRNFLTQFKEALKDFQDKTIFVDLFGGSGLLSHTVKRQRPDAKVIYNDFDYYTERLKHIPQTNRLLKTIREQISKRGGIADKKTRLSKENKELVCNLIKQQYVQEGYVDYRTLSASFLFGGNFTNSLDDFYKKSFYDRIASKEYNADGYLEGVEVRHCDYKELFKEFKDEKNVCFILDPPYLSTDVSTYYLRWGLKDYLNVLFCLQDTSYFYFTSTSTPIIEFCQWLDKYTDFGDPLKDATRKEKTTGINKFAAYQDVMFYKNNSGKKFNLTLF